MKLYSLTRLPCSTIPLNFMADRFSRLFCTLTSYHVVSSADNPLVLRRPNYSHRQKVVQFTRGRRYTSETFHSVRYAHATPAPP